MRNRLPLGVAVAALVVSVGGATPLGRAAISSAVPLARRAYLADTAKNAVRVGNSSRRRGLPPRACSCPSEPTAGSRHPSGQPGRSGHRAQKGRQARRALRAIRARAGSRGTRSVRWQRRSTARSNFSTSVSCTSGQKVVGGGISGTAAKAPLAASYPESDRVWAVGGTASASTSVTVYDLHHRA